MREISWPGRYAWSLRRELWEHPSIWIAPAGAAALCVLGVVIARLAGTAAARESIGILATEPYDLTIGVVMLGAYVAAIFYSLDALYGERRDRSVLFWKSMPVSDTATVIAKLTIPMLVIPLRASALTMAAVLVVLPLTPAHPPLLRTSALLLYHLLTVHSLWWAPLFGWLLLVSAWARRAPFVWALAPFFVVGVLERIALGTSRFTDALNARFMTTSPEAIVANGRMPTDSMTRLTPGVFLSSPGLWVGLGLTIALVSLAVQVRRTRGAT